MNLNKRILFPFTLLCFLFVSCVKDISTGHVNDIVLRPVFEADFIYSNRSSADFKQFNTKIDTIIPQLTERDTTRFPVLGKNDVVNKIEKIEFYFEVQNTIPEDFEIEIKYLDENNGLINTPIIIPVKKGNGPDTTPIISTQIDVLETEQVKNLGKASKVATSITANNVHSNSTGSFKIRSKGTYFMKIEL